jgi:ribosome biogenesis protein UTP30
MARSSSSSSEKAKVSGSEDSRPKEVEKKNQTKKMNDEIWSSSSKEGRVDQSLVERAVQALLKHHGDKQAASEGKSQLLGNDSVLQVQFRLLVGPTRPSPKPIAIALPHPICKMVRGGDSDKNDMKKGNDDDDDDGLDEAEVCFIVKDDSKPLVQEMIHQFPQYMANVKKVLSLESLRKKHASPTQRRALCHKYTLFLCDDRILPMMTKCLGQEFQKAKKMPIPVDMRRRNGSTAVPLAIHKALRSTFMRLRDAATCITVVAGTTGMRSNKLVDNVMAICERAVLKMPRQWANVQSIALTTTSCSHGLPVYNKIPAELEEISRMAGLPPIWKSSSQKSKEEESDDENEKKVKQQKVNKKRKELAAKSPLVRALKQQKKQRNTETAESNDKVENVDDEKAKTATPDMEKAAPDNTSLSTSNKNTTTSHDNEKNDKKAAATPKSETLVKSNKKSEKESSATKTSTEQHSPSKAAHKSSKKKDLSKKDKNKEGTSTKKRNNSMDDKDGNEESSSSSPDKKSRTSTGSVEKSSFTEASSFTKPFHAAAKFTGSKKGYVFRNGPDGLGYYVDVKPIVDKLAIAALVRMGNASQQQRGGGRRSSSSTPGKK